MTLKFYHLFILVVYTTSELSFVASWNTPSANQYHIQTDEGPERYFRYQTDSGQYRKEKRLEDGTVVGTYAWIDDDGILRQRDYIADNAGYRILKSKNVYVGRNVVVGEAVKAVKKLPASAGTLVSTNAARPVIRPVIRPVPNTIDRSYLSVVSTTPSTISSTPTYVEISPNGIHSSAVISSTPSPFVEITQNSIQSTTPISVQEPLLLLTPPKNSSYISTPNIQYIPSSTPPSQQYLPSSTPPPQYSSTTVPSIHYIPSTPSYETPSVYQSINQPLDQNSLDYNPYVNQVDNTFVFQNGPTYPITKQGQAYNGQKIGNGYDPQYPFYDGVSVTNDGFRYYIPRAYHEEKTDPGDKRTGSFGYIDPFGIRRVIYYNTAPGTGFQHRKNNRYVGFGATPYDPRPY